MTINSNRITLVGQISSAPVYDHTLYGEAFYKASIEVARLSGTIDTLPLTISERLSGSALNIGDRVCIHGQTRSYNLREDDTNRLVITVFVSNFEAADNAQSDLNEIEIAGNICKPVVYRMTPFSREISDILIAVNRRYGKSDYLPCIAWGRNARFASSLSVGAPVSIEGRLQSRIYQKKLSDDSIEHRTAYEISISTIKEWGRED